MDFTREPIIETVITPKEGCTLVVRSSKSSGQEEHFVDAIEVVVFGNAIFFRSRERPKAFLVPASDYEVLEVRETRLVLKNVGLDRSIKIAGGREASLRTSREPAAPKLDKPVQSLEPQEVVHAGSPVGPSGNAEEGVDARLDKKRDRRRNYRRRRGKDEEGIKVTQDENMTPELRETEAGSIELPPPHLTKAEIEASSNSVPVAAVLSSLLAPPPNLISETIARYKDNVLFKGAFFTKEDEDHEEGAEEDEASLEHDEEVTSEDEPFNDVPDAAPFEEVQVSDMTLDFPVYVSPESNEASLSRDFEEGDALPQVGDEGDDLITPQHEHVEDDADELITPQHKHVEEEEEINPWTP